VDAAIRRALEKIPADRFTSSQAFAKALADPAFRHGDDEAATAALAGAAGKRWRAVAAATSLVAVGSLAALALVAGASAPKIVTRTYLAFPEEEAPWTRVAGTLALSPDGSMLAYASSSGGSGGLSIWIKDRDALHARPLGGTSGAYIPVFSPDGRELAFIQDGRLKKMPVTGGPSLTLADDINTGLAGMAWLDDGSIVYNSDRDYRLLRTPSSGGPIDTLIIQSEHEAITARGQAGIAWPVGLPDGRGVLFGGCSSGCASVGLFVLDLRSGQVRHLVEGAGRALYVPTGHLVYVRGEDGAVFAAPFDLETLSITGPASPLMDGVGTWLGGATFVMSASGDLVYVDSGSGAGEVSRELVWVSPDGEEPVDRTWRGAFDAPALSPDGRTIAVASRDGDRMDIWLKTESAPPTRLTFGGVENRRPFWHPSGEIVGFLSARDGNQDLWMKRVDLTENAQLLLDLEEPINEGTWSPDGEWVAVRAGNGDLYAIRPGVDSVPIAIAAEPGVQERGPAISPDGRWVAYSSDEDGTPQIYVRPFPNAAAGAQRQVSTEGGRNPRWSADGARIFYDVTGNAIGVASVTLEPTFSPGARSIFLEPDSRYLRNNAYAQYAPDPHAPRILRVLRIDDSGELRGGRLVYVQNWLEALKAQVGGDR
jgi:serine/threonine-protein kinase